MPRFMDIVWLCTAFTLAIGFVNTSCLFFSEDYMSQPEDATFDVYEINTNQSITNTTPMDAAYINLGLFWAGLGMIWQLFSNAVYIYPTMVDFLHIPAPVAAVFQGALGLIWAQFFIQIIMRFPWGGIKS